MNRTSALALIVAALLIFAALCLDRSSASVATATDISLNGIVTPASIITVTNTNDSGPGSLRQALLDANDGDTIAFNIPDGNVISLTSGELAIDKNLTMSGPGAALLAISRAQDAPDFRILRVAANHAVTIQGVTISNGRAFNFADGGGILVEANASLSVVRSTISGNFTGNTGAGVSSSGMLTIESSTVSGNMAGDYGGGIENNGVLTINNSTISGNRGEFAAGAILNNGMLTMTNSTVSGNTTQLHGGGLGNCCATTAHADVKNCTFSGNSGSNGGAIYNRLGSLEIKSAVLKRGTIGPNISNDSATLTSHGYNLSDDNASGLLTGPGDQINTDPLLGPLQDNGGPTLTHALLPGSPAVNAGDPNFTPPPFFDQRGPGFARVAASRVDIGSFEAQTALTVTKTADTNGTCMIGNCSLREAIAASAPGDTVNFSALFNTPQTVTLALGELLVNKNLTIQGPGAGLLTVSGNNASRVFSIGGGFVVGLSGMKITLGNGIGASFNTFGGGVLNFGNLTVSNCTISGNLAVGGGGIFTEGTLTIVGSTISGNTASGDPSGTGGAIDNTGGTLVLTNSTVSGNSVLGNDGNGGGIITNGQATITSCTITNNSGAGTFGASGIYRTHGSVTLRNAIVAGNVNNATMADIVSAGSILSNGYNLIGNRGALTFNGPGDQSGTAASPLNPQLAPLANNGGPTLTHALLAGSTALDAGDSSGSSTDERGRLRPFDMVGIPNVSDGSDIGAFERQGWSRFDHDGDGRADVSVFRPSTGVWYLQQSSAGFAAMSWGIGSDKIVPADYDGDGRTDIAIYRPSEGNWYVLRSSNGTLFATHFGIAEDLPEPADFDADGRADVAVYRPSTGTWWILRTTNGLISAPFGTNEDKPVAADYDRIGRAELAVFRPSIGTWYYSSDLVDPAHHYVAVQFGLSTDLITPADLDGDGKTDIAVYRASTGTWYSLNSSNGALVATQFGTAEDVPTAADYDGDGKADICVFRPSSGVWYRLNSSTGAFVAIQFGTNGDRPTPAAFRY